MVTDELAPVIPVVMSDRSGTWWWPSSRARSPEQFLPLLSGLSPFQETVCRAQVATREPPVVVCDADHRGLVEDQLACLRVAPAAIVCEPAGRSTAAAIAAAAQAIAERPGALLLLLPYDHLVGDVQQFLDNLAAATLAAAAGYLVAFGSTPTVLESDAGHAHRSGRVAGIRRLRAADELDERPDPDRVGFDRHGRWLPRSGTFLVSRRVVLAELSTPERSADRPAVPAVGLATRNSEALRNDLEGFGEALSISLDCAVIDGGGREAVPPSSGRRNRVGAWPSGPEAPGAPADGNGVPTGMDPNAVVRPWGSFRSVDVGDHHQVKRLVVAPGQRLSLQRHQHRAEHWVVVQGTASIVRGEESRLLHENESVFIPVGCAHRLANPGSTPLHLVEVQVGDYLGEDDIERLADDYGRAAQEVEEGWTGPARVEG